MQLIENKTLKNADVLCKINELINFKCLRSIYFSAVHSIMQIFHGRALIKLNFREKQSVHTHNQDLRIPVHYLIF